MADKDQDASLREAAAARGFRLVKSRRRKPGGDFGRYGLVGIDSGRECLGFGADGLTATAEQVHAYLRGGEVASWKRSLIGVVGEGEAPAKKKAKVEEPAPPEPSRATPPEEKEERATPSPSAKARRGVKDDKPAPAASPPALAGGAGGGTSSTSKSAQSLPIREANRRDAAALAKLLGLPAATLAERLAAAIRAGEPPLVAMRGETVAGVAAWTILSALHQEPRGRLTLLLVAERERRQGVGTALIEAAEQHLAQAGVSEVELLLDIEFDAPTAFLGRTGWQRRTNGYGKQLG